MENQQSTDATINLITLNGFLKPEAFEMVNRFEAFNTRKPPMTSIWFSKKMMKNMIDLLEIEKNNKAVDGVRIYYARNRQEKNTVLLVSTYNDGLDPQTKKAIHQDYFEHDITMPLFTDGLDKYSLSGEICSDNSCGEGARLYEKLKDFSEEKDCDPGRTHFIRMQYANEMVWNFGSSVINTSCEWFDLEMFKAYLSTRFNGIRIYFGKRSNIDPIYPGLDGFVIVTTEDYIITGKEIPRRDFFDCTEINAHFARLINSSPIPIKILSDDNGEQCQPHCKGTSMGSGVE